MTAVRIGTFNVENLFARYRFRSDADVYANDGFTINDLAFDVYKETEKRITAQAIKEVNADVLCLQEVESLPVLDRFASQFLGGRGYKYRMLIDGNDPRFIDVAVLSKLPILDIRTHRHERNAAGTADLFSRDCLEVDVDVEGKRLTLYVNHFKSMMGGRADTRSRREEQVQRVATIIDDRWGPAYDDNFIVLGDFNDYVDANTSLTALVGHAQLVNVVDRLPSNEQWTHFYARENEYRQLDYILLPVPLDTRAGNPTPMITRNGLPHRAERYVGRRFDDVGQNRPKASDHAPLIVDIPKAALR